MIRKQPYSENKIESSQHIFMSLLPETEYMCLIKKILDRFKYSYYYPDVYLSWIRIETIKLLSIHCGPEHIGAFPLRNALIDIWSVCEKMPRDDSKALKSIHSICIKASTSSHPGLRGKVQFNEFLHSVLRQGDK